jgi:hypothetical protein
MTEFRDKKKEGHSAGVEERPFALKLSSTAATSLKISSVIYASTVT